MMNTASRRLGLRHLLRATALATLLVGSLTACGSGEESGGQPGDTLRLAYHEGLSTLPIRIAIENGYFEARDVDIEVTAVKPSPSTIAGMGKQYDMIQIPPDSIFVAVDKGMDLKFVTGLGTSTHEVPAFPVYTKDESITTWADLEGKKFGEPLALSFASNALRYQVAREGGDPKSIKASQVGWDVALDQLNSGRVDFVWSVLPLSTAFQGLNYLGDPTLDATGLDELVASVTAVTGEFAKNNPDALANFKKALLDAVEWIGANEDEAKERAVAWLKMPEALIVGHPLQNYKIDISAADLEPMLPILKSGGVFDVDGMKPLESYFVSQ